MTLEEILEGENLTPQQHLKRTKKFFEELDNVRFRYYKELIEDYNLSQTKAMQVYNYLFSGGPEVFLDSEVD